MAAPNLLRADQKGGLGLWGILRETGRVLSKNAKHFLCLYLALFLAPAVLLAAIMPPTSFKTSLLFIKDLIQHNNVSPSALPDHLAPPSRSTDGFMYSKAGTASLLALALFNVFVALPPLTTSVCRGYLEKSLSVRGSMGTVRKAAKGLALTIVCMYAAILGLLLGVALAVAVAVLLLRAMKMEAATMAVVVLAVVVALAGLLYISIQWTLMSPVVILDERGPWGWDALSRSSFLVRGKRGLAVGLMLVHLLLSDVLLLFSAASPAASLAGKIAAAAAYAVMQSLVGLFFVAAVVVLYMTCRAFHRESLESVSAARPEYGDDIGEGPKYVDLNHIDVEP